MLRYGRKTARDPVGDLRPTRPSVWDPSRQSSDESVSNVALPFCPVLVPSYNVILLPTRLPRGYVKTTPPLPTSQRLPKDPLTVNSTVGYFFPPARLLFSAPLPLLSSMSLPYPSSLSLLRLPSSTLQFTLLVINLRSREFHPSPLRRLPGLLFGGPDPVTP